MHGYLGNSSSWIRTNDDIRGVGGLKEPGLIEAGDAFAQGLFIEQLPFIEQ